MAAITARQSPSSRYRAPVPPRHVPPMPPPWTTQPPSFRGPPPLSHFVLLSILLHVLLIALFGAPTGGSREGRAMWGSMQLELRGLLIDTGRAPYTAPRIEARERAAIEAPPAPARVDRGEAEGAVPLTPPAETQAAAVAPSGPAIVEVPTPFPPLLDRVVRPEPALDEPPPLRVPPPTEGRDLRPPPRERPAPSPVEVPAPLPLAPSARPERVLAEPPPLAAPVLQPIPAPAPRAPVPAERASEETPAVPAAPTTTQPVESQPVEVRAIPVPSLESIAIPRGDAPAPVEMAPMPEIRVAPAPQAAERAAPSAPAAPARLDPEVARVPGDARAPAAGSDPRREGPARRPDDPSTSYDPTAPALDVDRLRQRAGQLAREGSGQRAVLPFPMPAVPDRKSKMEAAIDGARKPDCRTAYQGLGLAAIVPLIANEFGEGRCRW